MSTPKGQGAAFERRAVVKDLSRTPEIHISRGDVIEGFVVTMIIVMVDEGGNGLLQLPGEIEVLQTEE